MRRYTLRQLDLFAALARTGSLTQAAAACHLTQPAVSMQVKQLEETLGVPLAEPAGRGVRLTDAGTEIAAAVEEVLASARNLDDLASRWRGARSGLIRLGVVSTAKYFLPQLLAQFLKAHPGVDFRMTIHNREQVLSELRGNTVDFVIMGRPPEGIECDAVPFAPNLLGIVAAPGHPFSRRRALDPKALATQSFIVREHGSGTRAAMERFFAGKGVPIRAAMEMASNESIKQAVIAGLGLGFLSLHTVRNELTWGRLVLLDVAGLPVRRQWYCVRRQGRRLAPAAEAFRHFLAEEGAALMNSEDNLIAALTRPRARKPAPRGRRRATSSASGR